MLLSRFNLVEVVFNRRIHLQNSSSNHVVSLTFEHTGTQKTAFVLIAPVEKFIDLRYLTRQPSDFGG